MFSTNRRPSALAMIAASAASSASPVVRFSITHRGHPVPGAPTAFRTTASAQSEEGDSWTESLIFKAASSDVRISTCPSTVPEQATSRSDTGYSTEVVDDGFRFLGAIGLNPNFLYEFTRSTELLLTLKREWRPDYRDSLMVGMIVESLASAAAETAKSPILFAQSPVAPFREPRPEHRSDGSGEVPRPTAGLCVRASVRVDESRAIDRLALLIAVSELAKQNGLGLHVGDIRLGRVQGEWWTVYTGDEKRYDERKNELFSWIPDGYPTAAMQLTVAGPARVGSTLAVMKELTARGMGVLAISNAALQELAFITLLLPVTPPRVNSSPMSPTTEDALRAIRRLARDCGLTPVDEVQAPPDSSFAAAVDYLAFGSGPVTVELPRGGPAEHPVWVSWEMPEGFGSVDVPAILAECASRQTSSLSSCHLDYSRSRRLSNGRCRGRTKLSVSVRSNLSQRALADLLGDLAVTVQTAATAALVDRKVPQRDFTLRVAWRERWLGGWDGL